MTLELRRPLSLDRIEANGSELVVEATPSECLALAVRMNLPEVTALSCRFHLAREGHDRIYARGMLRARIKQVCVASLEEFATTLEEVFQLRFVPAGEETDDVDPDSDDEIPFVGNVIDLGEAAAEQLALALDPYPRMPGTELQNIEDEQQPHPFAVLRRLH